MQSGKDNTKGFEKKGNILFLNWNGGFLSVYFFNYAAILDIYVSIHAFTYTFLYLYFIKNKCNW